MHVARLFTTSLSLLASGAFALVAGTANAGQSCDKDTDCSHGFACQVVGASGCPDIACAPGETCNIPACDPQTFKECVPGPCNAHSDCADGMVCYARTSTSCSNLATPECPPDTKCDAPAPEPPDCTTETIKSCVPLYVLPCTTDEGCGAGFDCVQDSDACACGGSAPGNGTGTSGSSGSSSGSAGGSGTDDPPPSATPPPKPAPTPLPPDCTCTPATTKHCTPKATSCTADSDCPKTWSCTVTATSGGSCTGGAERLPDGGFKEIPTVCTSDPAPTTKQCTPPSYGYSGYGEDKSGGEAPQTGGNTGTPVSGSAGSANGDPGSAPHDDGNGATPPSGTSTDGKGTPSSDNTACQMGSGHGSTNAASVLALLGIAGLARRRRTRWA